MSSAQLKKFSRVKPAQIEWRNGLPYSTEFEDVYFSVHGAVEESQHVFIEGNCLEKDWKELEQNRFYIAELGFGSGLNFLNTIDRWAKNLPLSNLASQQKTLHYIAIEKRPFSIDDLQKACALWPQFSDFISELIHHYPSQTYGRHQIEFPKWRVTLTLIFMPIEEALDDLITESKSQQNKTEIDHWFLDGFAPTKNASMWGQENADKIAKLSKIGSRLATYSVAASVKRPLTEAGFDITKRKGFAKKREMLTAKLGRVIKSDNRTQTVNIKFESPWFNLSKNEPSISTVDENKIAIIGGGIAGCTLAYTLTRKGFDCDLFETNTKIAKGASGAAAGIFHPQLTSDMNINSQYNWLAYLTLLGFLHDLNNDEKDRIILSQGVERFLESKKVANNLLALADEIGLNQWIKKSSQFDPIERCVSFPNAAAIDLTAFCELLINKIADGKLAIKTNTTINGIARSGENWQILANEHECKYRHVIYCGGAKSTLLNQLDIRAINTTRGQTCVLGSNGLSRKIETTLCEQVYLVPRKNGEVQLGTTFEDFEDDQLNQQSQNDMLTRSSLFMKEIGLGTLSKNQIEQTSLNGTVGYRLHSLDRMPIVGPAPNYEKLNAHFKNLGQKRLRLESIEQYNLPGLWLNTAYGSHGLLYSLLASRHLAALITNDISSIQTDLSNALHPARFYIKSLKKRSRPQ